MGGHPPLRDEEPGGDLLTDQALGDQMRDHQYAQQAGPQLSHPAGQLGVRPSPARCRRRAVAIAGSGLAAVRSNAPVAQVVRFGWHYLQMSVAMYLGMLLPVGLILSALGLSHLLRSPEASALLMTAEMVPGMAAWMCIRRHCWRHTVEMSAGMSASTVVAAAATLVGLLPHTAAESEPVFVLMWAGMLGAMLFRWLDYAQHHHGHRTHEKAVL